MDNQDIADIFRETASLLELRGDNPFRIRAYLTACRNIESLPVSLKSLYSSGKLESLSGIGKDLSSKIKEIIDTGRLKNYEELKKSIPSGLVKMLDIPGLGPKTIRLIYEELKISDIDALEKAAFSGRLKELPKIKDKTEENIIKGIKIFRSSSKRKTLLQAEEVSGLFMNRLKKIKEVTRVETAGSLRRRKDTVGDIDILAVSLSPEKVMDRFVSFKEVKDVQSKGKTKSSVISHDGMRVDLRVVDKDSFGSALMYFTGSKNFNISLRRYARKKGYKINEYGVFKIKGSRELKVSGKEEKDIFSLFKMEYIPPVLREDRGEIDLALNHSLPDLVEVGDIKGDLHVHSNYSDGADSILDMALSAQKKGYVYLGVCDHSQGLKVAKGLSPERVFKKIEEIKKLNKKLKGIRILAGTEVDILSDGSLDYSDNLLKEFDIVVASIHSGFKQPEDKITKRILSAVKNRYVDIVGHPTGRLFGVRSAYEVDLDAVLKACSDYNVALEINAYPQRLDLNDINCLKAKERGVKLSVNTDSHRVEHLDFMRFGVDTARRGRLEKEGLINTLDFEELVKWRSRA